MDNSTIEIPNKSLFKINEICGLTGVKPYVLRFWETEFEEISPVLSATGQKLYEHKDIEAIIIIKKLLYADKMSIPQAKVELRLIINTNQQLDDEIPNPGKISEIPQLNRQLFNKDIQKLVVAKNKLKSLVDLTNSLKKQHGWH